MPAKTISPDRISGVAIDLGGTKIAVGRFQCGQLTFHNRCPTNSSDSIDELLHKMTGLAVSAKLCRDDVLGVAVTGRIDQHGAWHAVNDNTLSRVSAIPLGALLNKQLASHLDSEPVVLNDAVAGAVAEFHLGAGMGSQRVAYVTVSTGVGAGIVLDGVPLTSPKGLVGHVGFMSSRYASRQCGSGRIATVESIASGRAIARSAALAGHEDLDAKQVFECHYQGQRWATDIVSVSARAIAELCADLVALLDIERVVIGGSIGLANGYSQLVQRELARQPELFQPVLLPASLGSDSVLLGALLSGIIGDKKDKASVVS